MTDVSRRVLAMIVDVPAAGWLADTAPVVGVVGVVELDFFCWPFAVFS